MLASKESHEGFEFSQACFGTVPDDLCKLFHPSISTGYGIRVGSTMIGKKPQSKTRKNGFGFVPSSSGKGFIAIRVRAITSVGVEYLNTACS